MSGRRRHSDSKRRHSQLSPKRYRRDEYGKEERERVTSITNAQNEAPLAKHSKPNDPNQLPTSLSCFQLDERGGAGQVGQITGQRKASERGWWKDSKNQLNEREETSHGREQRDQKSQAILDDNTFQRRDGFTERKDDPPTLRKRPAFREKKILVNSGDANVAAAMAVKSSQIDHPLEKNDRKEERNSNPHHLDSPEKHFADDRAPNKGEARRDRFPSSGRRYGSNDSYGGRDKFNGRQGYRPGKTQTEKWKHDLYQEVNKDPIPQNEDDQIAKLEALLAS